VAQRVHLHVGTPKSGTTYLQDTLWQNRASLAERGLLFPGRRPFDHNRASGDVRRGRHLGGTDKPAAWNRLRRAVARHEGTAVLSNEWYVAASAPQARAAVEQLGGDIVDVVITTRTLVRLVPAAWQESLKVGRGTSLGDFVDLLDAPSTKWRWGVLDPALVAHQWAEVVGPERVHVVTMPEQTDDRDLLWTRFATTLGLTDVPVDRPPRRVNESLSVEATRLLQELGPDLAAEADRVDSTWRGRSTWLREEVVRGILADLPGAPIGVGPELRERLLERAAASVADLRDLGCRVTGDLDELLEGTDRPGSRHPDTVTPTELLDGARALASGLLRARIAAGTGDAGGATEKTPATTAPAADPARSRRVTFLVPSAYYAGGIARTVFTCANELAARGFEVGVITLNRSAEKPYFDVDPRIRITALQQRWNPDDPEQPLPRVRRDPRAGERERALDAQPSSLAPKTHKTFTAYVDARLEEELSALPPGVVVTTRPEFAVAAARWADPQSILLHQEHLSFLPRPAQLRQALRQVSVDSAGRRIDALLTLTEADLERWRELLGDDATGLRTGVIPNPTPFQVGDPAPLTSTVVIAAGRFTAQKGFERLVRAFAPLARTHPEWQLRIYGTGPQQAMVEAEVEKADVGDRILLPGVTDAFEQELANASVYAMSSRYEGLPMVLLESLSKGVPPVSFDCPEGPRQLIEDDRNGVLVPEGDVPALTDALRRLMDDDDLRRRLGAGALESARGYQVGPVVDQWVTLIDEIDAERRAQGR